jgi:hypothetical protein
MARVLFLALLTLLGAVAAGCAAKKTADTERLPAFETGWQRPDPTGTNFYKPALSGGTAVEPRW